MIGIGVENLSKTFGGVPALDHVSLRIEPGEIFFLLGPSGCGKTTLLRTLAGFCTPDSGVIRFGGEDVTRLPAHQRRTGMVFQNYALWPHKNVAENVAFGLEELGVPRAERRKRVAEALEAVHMGDCAARHIHELSGGQQQRVALARALVVRPRCLLLDEPLSNLDAKLRLEMRAEIRRICKQAGLTAVYVTHDQKEALSIADRMAVLQAGRVCQIGEPEAVYRQPASRFVADFVGETNFLDAEVIAPPPSHTGGLLASAAGDLFETAAPPERFAPGARVTLSIRPEAWRLGPASRNALPGRVQDTIYLGEMAEYRVVAGKSGSFLKVFELNPRRVTPGENVILSAEPRDVVVLPHAQEP